MPPKSKVGETLAPFSGERSAALREAVKVALKAFGEEYFEITPEKVDEVGMDSAQLSRAEFLLGQIEKVQFLLHAKPTGWKEKLQKAEFARRIVKDYTDGGFKALQIGRTKQDDDLAKEVAAQREEIRQLAEWKSQHTPTKEDEVLDVRPTDG